MAIEKDAEREGILRMVYVGEQSLEELEEGLGWSRRNIEAARDRKERLGLLSIAAPDSRMNSTQRSRAASWLKENDALLRQTCVGHAVVLSNPLQRGVLTAILWLGDYAIPIRAFASESEARRWLYELLDVPGVRASI